jgi:hypothetical protein
MRQAVSDLDSNISGVVARKSRRISIASQKLLDSDQVPLAF